MQLRSSGDTAAVLPRYLFLEPDFAKREAEVELEQKLRTEGDPEQPPPRRPGDRYITGGAIVGVVVGGVGGGIAAQAYTELPVVVLVVGGILVGGLLGLFIGDRLKQRAHGTQRNSRELRR